MTAYNKTRLLNWFMMSDAVEALQQNVIFQVEYDAIKEKHRDNFYSVGIFARIGLYILTWLVAWCLIGLMFLIFFSIDNVGVLFIVASCILLVFLEFFISKKLHFRSGVDDALCHATVIFACFGLDEMLNLSAINVGLITLFISLAAAIRYLDKVTAILAFLSLHYILSSIIEKTTLLPWASLIHFSVSLLIWWLAKSIKTVKIHYESLMKAIQYTVLFFSYIVLCFNLFIGGKVLSQPNIYMSIIETLLIVITPFVFTLIGFMKKDIILFRSGLLILLLMVYKLLSLEHFNHYGAWLSMIGVIGIFCGWYLIKFFQKPFRNHVAFEENNSAYEGAKEFVNAENLTEIKNPPSGFGGGSFGGGGASGNF